MKKIVLCLLVVAALHVLDAKIARRARPLLEIGPKGSLYLGSDVAFGIGAEVVANPLRNLGVRFDLSEIQFGNTTAFYLNHGTSIDALFYIPMRTIEPYVHAGMGFSFTDLPSPAGSLTLFAIRFGMGFVYEAGPRTNFVLEPGIIIEDRGANDVETLFRLSFGARFGVL